MTIFTEVNGRGLTFDYYFVPEPNSGCWLWMGKIETRGYGQFHMKGGLYQAHRYAYEAVVGPIPSGLVLDHKCRNRACVNPDHLEPASQRANILRGTGMAARNVAKTHCKCGHALEPDYQKDRAARGWRQCRVCEAIRKQKLYAKRKAVSQ